MKKVAIIQSNYIPWKGYFDIVGSVDEFIIYDDMQYTRRDWRNRNKIKTPQGLQWLTVPVRVKGKYTQTIRETEIDGVDWAARHWRSLHQNYRHSPFFDEMAPLFEPLFLDRRYVLLSELNRDLIETVCRIVGIETRISSSWDYRLSEGKSERLADLCLQAGASEYVSGPSAKGYIEESVFLKRGVKLSFFDYSGYPEYPQPWGSFVHEVSILDLLFNCGKAAPAFMKFRVGTPGAVMPAPQP